MGIQESGPSPPSYWPNLGPMPTLVFLITPSEDWPVLLGLNVSIRCRSSSCVQLPIPVNPSSCLSTRTKLDSRREEKSKIDAGRGVAAPTGGFPTSQCGVGLAVFPEEPQTYLPEASLPLVRSPPVASSTVSDSEQLKVTRCTETGLTGTHVQTPGWLSQCPPPAHAPLGGSPPPQQEAVRGFSPLERQHLLPPLLISC